MPHTILIYGHDPQLLATRALVLRSHGYSVVAATLARELEELLGEARVEESFGLLLLCHSVQPEESVRWLAQTVCSPALRKLQLDAPMKASSGRMRACLGAQQTFDATRGPAALLQQIDSLFAHQTGTDPVL
jgi:hypothetical protein